MGDNQGRLAEPEFQVVVVGAGVAGLAALHHLKERGVRVLLLDRNADVGGTWFKNRYPGCRFDSESFTYGYSFSKEVLDEWHWKERYSAQPENLRYLRFVTERLSLRDDIRFDCTVTGAEWHDDQRMWTIEVADGSTVSTRMLMTCLGGLSTPTLPRVPGVEDFAGPWFHTFDWPEDGIELRGKRVGVVGTGASGVQAIAALAPEVESLTVFQRRPNWHSPLRNRRISEEEMADIRSKYQEIFEACAASPGGYLYRPDRRGFWSLTPEQRREFWEHLYEQPGFALWLSNFREIFMDKTANAEFSSFVAEQIRGRVNDKVLVESLIPVDHGFGVQRVPLESGYYEVYNRENVHLVDLQKTPIERIVRNGIRTTARDYDLDVIVYATGFDAITGAYDKLDLRGVDGVRLRDKWAAGPETFLGILIRDFPNLLMVGGPQSSSSSVNFPRSIETQVDWCMQLFDFLRERGITRFEPTADAEEEWVAHVASLYDAMLVKEARSWFTGYNSNVPGHEAGTIRHVMYNGGQPKYRKLLNGVAADRYGKLVLS